MKSTIESSRRKLQQFLEEWRTKPPDEVAVSPEHGGRFGRRHASAGPPSPRRKEYMAMYRQWLRPFRASLIVLFLITLVSTGLAMVPPMGLQLIIDRVLLSTEPTAARMRLLHFYGLGMITLIVISQVIQIGYNFRTNIINARITMSLRQVLFDRLVRLPLDQLHELKSGGVVSRLSGDIEQTAGLVHTSILTPLMAIVRFVLALGFLFYISWQLALVSIVIVPPVVVLNAWWSRRLRPIYRSAGQDAQASNARATETFGGIRVVRAFAREFKEERDFFISRDSELRKNILARVHQLGIQFIWEVMMPGINVLIVWVGGYIILRGGKITIGGLLAYQWYAHMLIGPVWMMVNSISQTQRSLASMERVFDIVSRNIEMPDAPDAVSAPAKIDEIRFANVNFEYKADVPVLKNINLTVPGGSMIALVGPSGAGKTTIANLVARFSDPKSGQILINGIDLRQIKLQSYRRLLGVVEQDVFLFDGTVRDNIAYGRRGATQDEIIAAAQRANADKFIREFPDGYDTLIGERGVKLSGGQRQRLSIARAILADPDILILDEATSNLDSESEQLIQAALNELFAGRTTFVIAHRLSTIAHADLIVVINEGQIVEMGRHDELLARDGQYRQMVDRQRMALERLQGTLEWR